MGSCAVLLFTLTSGGFFLKTAKPVKPELHVKDASENNVGLLCYNFFEGDF